MPRKISNTNSRLNPVKLELEKETVGENSFSVFARTKKFVILILLVVILAALGYLYKDKFIVATINGKPIFRYQLSQRLTAVYGKETLENMIVETLIGQEAKRQKIDVTASDIDEEIAKVTKSLGEGMKLEDALKFQGLSLAEFKRQLELRLQVNRILDKEISITPEETDKYLKDNAKTLVATGEAERKTEAQGLLKEQKINERVQTWVSELLQKAKITRFLK